MHVKQALVLLVILLAMVSCAPAVPYDRMPGYDLYSSAQENRMRAEEAIRLAQMQEAALTATAQAPVIRITETAAALAVEATQAQSTSVAGAQTQAGAMTATAIWWTPTPNATGTLEALALSAAQTQTTLNLQREQDINDFKGKLPAYSFVTVVLVLAIALMLITRRWRYQPARVDARGNILPILDIVEGTYTDIDRSPNFKGSISNDLLVRLLAHIFEKKFGLPPQLPAVTASRQDATTERDQMIDLASRGSLGSASETKEQKKLAAQQMMKQLSDSNLESRFKILDGSTNNLDVIDGQVIQVLDNDWKEAVKK